MQSGVTELDFGVFTRREAYLARPPMVFATGAFVQTRVD